MNTRLRYSKDQRLGVSGRTLYEAILYLVLLQVNCMVKLKLSLDIHLTHQVDTHGAKLNTIMTSSAEI